MAQRKKQAARKKTKDLPDLVAEETPETFGGAASGSTAGGSSAAGSTVAGGTAADARADVIEEERLRKIAEEMAAGSDGKIKRTPTWYIALMLGFMVIGLLWLMVFYISGTTYPIPGIEYWNIGIGVGLMMVGLVMTTGWR